MLLYTPSYANDRDASTSTEGRDDAMEDRGLKTISKKHEGEDRRRTGANASQPAQPKK
jgi:hypothetical protein